MVKEKIAKRTVMMRGNTWRFFPEKSYLLTVRFRINLDVLFIYSKDNCMIWHLLFFIFRLYLISFHQVYRQYWNTDSTGIPAFFKHVHAPTYPLLVEGR